jgi:hypothetical protein
MDAVSYLPKAIETKQHTENIRDRIERKSEGYTKQWRKAKRSIVCGDKSFHLYFWHSDLGALALTKLFAVRAWYVFRTTQYRHI